MSAATIRDKIALKVLNLAAAKNVYSNASTSALLAPWPSEFVDDGPHAIVGRGSSRRTGGTNRQLVERGVDVEWRFSAVDVANAERLMDTLEDQIVAEFSSGITLGGSVIECTYTGADRPFQITDESAREWVVWITHFRAVERFSTEMTP